MTRLPKFDVDLPSPSRESRPTLQEREVMITKLYNSVYIAVIRNSPQPNGAEVLLYLLHAEGVARLAHVLSIDMFGRFTLSVVDNLVVVHHQGWKTSLLFDISSEVESTTPYKRHQPVLAPLSIAPTKVEMRRKRGVRGEPVTPELYSQKWVFFPPNIVVDAQYGVMWRVTLNLSTISSMMTDKCTLLQFLLMRQNGKKVILEVFRDSIRPGRQANLSVLGGMFDQISHAYKSMVTPVKVEKRYEVMITQKDIYDKVFVPFADHKDMPYKFLVAVVVEYIRSLNKLAISVEHFLFELVMNLLIENKCYYQLHQFLQYHVISDSKPLALLLLSRELVYPPATQLAMDMFKRLKTADSEIIDILLTRGQILTALRFIKSTDKVDSVSARQFLEAAANEDDKTLFYTVFRFFIERNMRLRRKPEFPPDEHCQPYEQLYKKWFKNA